MLKSPWLYADGQSLHGSSQVYRPKSFLGPKEERVKPLPDSLLGWIVPFFKQPTSAIIESNGLDAYMFVDYIEMMICILGPIFIFTWVLLLPIYAVSTSGGKTGFQQLTFGQVGTGVSEQKRYVAPLLVQWVITFWILYQIRKHVMKFIKLRQEFITSPKHASSPQARTLLITGIPNEYLSERKLKEMYRHLPGGVERVWLNRDLKKLADIFDERTKALNKLEAAESKVIKTAYKKVKKGKVPEQGNEADDIVDRYLAKKERPTMKAGTKLGFFGGKKVDTVEHLRSDIERLNNEIAERRHNESEYKPANAAFLLFRTQVGCHMAKGITAHHEPYKMARRYVDAHPDSLIWPNLSMNPYAQKIRTAVFWAATVGLIIVWLPLIGFTAVVSNLNGLCIKVSWLAWVCNIGAATGIIQGFLPTILLAVLNILLPIFLRLFARLSGIPTRNGVELSLQQRMTLFNLIDNFLLFTIISGVSSGINQIVNVLSNPQGLPSLISQYIPLANTFYISFIILQALAGAAGGLLQVTSVVIYYIKAFILAGTPRKSWHVHHDVGAPAWGVLFPAITLITTVTFGYAVLAPLINGFAFVAFILFWVLYKYTATYVWDMKPANETSGLFFMQAINASMAGLYLSQLILTVLFFVAQQTDANGNRSQSSIPEGVFMVVLMVITVGFHIVLLDSVGDLPTALPLSLVRATNGSSHDDRATIDSDSSPTDKERFNTARAANAGSNVVSSGALGADRDAKPGQYLAVGNIDGAHGFNGHDKSGDAQAFLHPALRDPQRTLWYPCDRFGLSAEAVARAREHGLDATDEGAGFDPNNRITTDMYEPPGEQLL